MTPIKKTKLNKEKVLKKMYGTGSPKYDTAPLSEEEIFTARKQLSYGKEKTDWTYFYILVMGIAVGIIVVNPHIINCVDNWVK